MLGPFLERGAGLFLLMLKKPNAPTKGMSGAMKGATRPTAGGFKSPRKRPMLGRRR